MTVVKKSIILTTPRLMQENISKKRHTEKDISKNDRQEYITWYVCHEQLPVPLLYH